MDDVRALSAEEAPSINELEVARLRREARRCRREAGQSTIAFIRDQWLTLAGRYDKLVADAEAALKDR